MPDWEGRGVHEHPGTEALSAFVDGTLDDRERAAVEAHVADCEECLELVSEVMQVQPEDVAAAMADQDGSAARAPAGVLPFTRRRWVWAAAAAAAAAVMAVTLLPFGRRDNPAFEQLVVAVGEERVIEGRLSGGFLHGPVRSPRRSGSPQPSSESLLAAVAGLQQRAEAASAGPDELHAYGVGLLLLGDLDPAIDTLQRAAALKPGDDAIRGDLGAALMTRAASSGNVSDWDRALAAVDEALRLRPEQVEALFNRALVLTRMGRDAQARHAWSLYLQRDPESPWSRDARRYLAEIDSAPSSR